MVIPYQIWMLQRVAEALANATAREAGLKALSELLGTSESGLELLELDTLLAGCRVRKEGALLYSV